MWKELNLLKFLGKISQHKDYGKNVEKWKDKSYVEKVEKKMLKKKRMLKIMLESFIFNFSYV